MFKISFLVILCFGRYGATIRLLSQESSPRISEPTKNQKCICTDGTTFKPYNQNDDKINFLNSLFPKETANPITSFFESLMAPENKNSFIGSLIKPLENMFQTPNNQNGLSSFLNNLFPRMNTHSEPKNLLFPSPKLPEDKINQGPDQARIPDHLCSSIWPNVANIHPKPQKSPISMHDNKVPATIPANNMMIKSPSPNINSVLPANQNMNINYRSIKPNPTKTTLNPNAGSKLPNLNTAQPGVNFGFPNFARNIFGGLENLNPFTGGLKVPNFNLGTAFNFPNMAALTNPFNIYGGLKLPNMNLGANLNLAGLGLGLNSNLNAGLGPNPHINAGFGINSNLNAGTGLNPNVNGGTGLNPNINSGFGLNPNLNAGIGLNPNINAGLGLNPNLNAGTGFNPNVNAGFGQNPNLNGGTGLNPNLNAGLGLNPNQNAGTGLNPNLYAGLGQNPNMNVGNLSEKPNAEPTEINWLSSLPKDDPEVSLSPRVNFGEGDNGSAVPAEGTSTPEVDINASHGADVQSSSDNASTNMNDNNNENSQENSNIPPPTSQPQSTSPMSTLGAGLVDTSTGINPDDTTNLGVLDQAVYQQMTS